MKQKTYGISIQLPEEVTDLSLEYRLIPGDVSMHRHDFYEIEVVVSGSATQILNGQSCQLRRGCVTLLAPSDFHAVIPHKDLYVYNFMFRESMISEKYLNNIRVYGGNKFLNFDGKDLQEIISICQILELEYDKQSQERSSIMKNLMECFFLLLLRAMQQQSLLQEKANGTIQASIQYLHQHYLESPSIPQTASAVGLSPNYLAHRFRKMTGQSYTEYLTNLKLGHVKRLLLTSNMSITEICFASGFTSISNFTKVFKKHTGLSARQFVQKYTIANAVNVLSDP